MKRYAKVVWRGNAGLLGTRILRHNGIRPDSYDGTTFILRCEARAINVRHETQVETVDVLAIAESFGYKMPKDATR